MMTLLIATALTVLPPVSHTSAPTFWGKPVTPPDRNLIIGPKDREFFMMRKNGEIVIGEDYSKNEAAKGFWDAVREYMPKCDCK